MKPYRRLLTALLAALPSAPAAAQLPRLLPVPVELKETEGAFRIGPGTAIVAASDDSGARNAAERLAALVKGSRGFAPAIAANAKGVAIRFVRAPTGEAESYRLHVDGTGATITAGDDAGLLYGAVTLWQAMTQAAGQGAVTVPGFAVRDAPRFHWRGLMLDSARHFQSTDYVRKLIDWMAVNKLNTLHWHLVDDQGWRIEIRKYPKLTQVSGWRAPATAPGAPPLPKVGGFYTQDEIRAIIAYAAKRNITIVPEIEMPGHALAAIRAYPWLGTGTPIPPGTESDWGVFPWLYNVDDRTFGFLEDVLGEVIALFPSKYIHVGGDEAVKDQWKASPTIQAQMKSLGIKDETALQSWFVHRIEKFVSGKGRRLIGWDEILEGGMPEGAAITSWRGIDGAIAAAKAGHDAVLSPAPTLYFDNRQGFGPSEPPGRGNLIDLKTVYGFDPAPDAIPAAAQHHILGLQANLWAEHVRTEARSAWMFFPRASAVAEIGWSREQGRSFPDFVTRVVPQMARMRALGLAAASSAFEVHPALDYKAGARDVRVSLSNQAGLEMRYSTDGSAVKADSPVYSAPLALKFPAVLKASAFLDGHVVPGSAIVRQIDARAVLRRSDEELKTCSNKVVLALDDDYPATGKRAIFLTDIFNPCWLYDAAPVGGARQIAIEVGQFPFNFQIGDDINHIKFSPPATPAGEFEVRAGSCKGPRIAVLPLAPAVANPGLTRLVAPIEARRGNEDLCISYTAKGVEPMWAVESVELIP
ncbi:MAG: family 20 glycosylhydrolase [Sphingomonas sp.]